VNHAGNENKVTAKNNRNYLTLTKGQGVPLDRPQSRFLSLPLYQICAFMAGDTLSSRNVRIVCPRFIFVRIVQPSTLLMQSVGFSEMSICIYASQENNKQSSLGT
jgi:hypothetical protein